MIGTFFEGVAAVVLPCTWTIAVPAVLMVIASRGNPTVTAGVTVALMAGASLRAAGVTEPGHPWTIAVGVLMAAGFVAATRSGPVAVAGGAVTMVAAVLLWRPCVGPHLGTILTRGLDHPLAAAIAMIPFSLGVAIVVPGAWWLARLVKGGAGARAAGVAAALGVAIGGAVVLGVHETLSSTLARWSVDLLAS